MSVVLIWMQLNTRDLDFVAFLYHRWKTLQVFNNPPKGYGFTGGNLLCKWICKICLETKDVLIFEGWNDWFSLTFKCLNRKVGHQRSAEDCGRVVTQAAFLSHFNFENYLMSRLRYNYNYGHIFGLAFLWLKVLHSHGTYSLFRKAICLPVYEQAWLALMMNQAALF